MSPSLPPAGVDTAIASMRPVITQPAVGTLVFKSSAMVPSAALTSVISEPKPSTANPMTTSSTHR